jgi:hypothetical protein
MVRWDASSKSPVHFLRGLASVAADVGTYAATSMFYVPVAAHDGEDNGVLGNQLIFGEFRGRDDVEEFMCSQEVDE